MMQVKWTRGLSLAILSAAVLLAASPAAYANCAAGVPGCNNTGAVFMQGMGTLNPTVFVWTNKSAIQRLINPAAAGTGKAAGNDSGAFDTVFNNFLFDLNPPNGDYVLFCIDNGNTGFDGCGTETTNAAGIWENDATCGCGITTNCGWRPTNAMVGAADAAAPLVGRIAVYSVDMDPVFTQFNFDDVGAPNTPGGCGLGVNADACQGSCADGSAGIPSFAIPQPQWGSSQPNCAGGTCNISMNIPDVSGITASLGDDCNVAESRAVNCPRNLYFARRLVARRAACDTTSFDLRTFPEFTEPPASLTNVAPNWFNLASQDLNLNGIQDGGEVAHTPIQFTGTTATPANFTLPVVAGATDCLYIAMAIVLDGAPLPTYEPVLSNVVSVNPLPYRPATGTAVSDRVYDIRAAKAQGQITISWSTNGEFTTAGFNVYGGKKAGEIKLNSSQIDAKEGTTGKGASYQISVGSGTLKGSTNVFVEVVKTDGTSERFGPASVK